MMPDTYLMLALAAVLMGALAGVLYLSAEARTLAQQAVAAGYRAGFKEAAKLADSGLEWLAGPEGAAFRQMVAHQAYAALPTRIRLLVPAGVWAALVEVAFQGAKRTADELRSV